MPAHGDKFRTDKRRFREVSQAIELMEARKLKEDPPVIIVLDKNIEYCKRQLNEIMQNMIRKGYKGEGL